MLQTQCRQLREKKLTVILQICRPLPFLNLKESGWNFYQVALRGGGWKRPHTSASCKFVGLTNLPPFEETKLISVLKVRGACCIELLLPSSNAISVEKQLTNLFLLMRLPVPILDSATLRTSCAEKNRLWTAKMKSDVRREESHCM